MERILSTIFAFDVVCYSKVMGKNAAFCEYLGEPKKVLETVQYAKRTKSFCPDDLFVDEGMCYFQF